MNICSTIKKSLKIILDDKYRFMVFSNLGFYAKMDDKKFLEKKFEAVMGRKLYIDNPKTYNEKLQWLKLYDRNSFYTCLVDKYKVREYISETIGEDYLIPLLGVWNRPEDINFDLLPKQFVLKCNHNSGLGMCVCINKENINVRKVKKNLKKGMKQNYYLINREWPYKNVDRKIIAEKFIGTAERTPDDYKFLVINGEIDSIMICKDRDLGKPKYYYFDLDWNRLYYQIEEPTSKENIQKPENFEKMVEIVKKLSRDLKTIRIDLYNTNGKIYFGEITFFNSSGFDLDITYDTDFALGNKLDLLKKEVN